MMFTCFYFHLLLFKKIDNMEIITVTVTYKHIYTLQSDMSDKLTY